ncbi:MAG: calcium-translocating P-type ATPase, PMCA-type [Clostridia bacterium]|nr:calcium-translocating P-type ATPase, PMCA-type [Clostridia bacterium]
MKAAVMQGLTEEQVDAARKAYGANVLSQKKRKGFIRQFVGNLGDPIIKVLLCALGIHVILMFRQADWFETVGIAISVFLATLISTLSEYGSEAAFAKLSESCRMGECRVRRDGHVRQISADDIVVGDVVLLQAGEMIPADGRLLWGTLSVDQSSMTGESAAMQKRPGHGGEHIPQNPACVFGGCTVLQGEGEMLVEAVGDATFLGGISGEVQTEVRDSPLKVRLGKLAQQISRMGYTAAVLVAVVYLIHAFVLDAGFDAEIMMHRLRDWQFVLEQLFRALTLGLSVVVMAVPEGLPMMVAVVLSSNVKRMIRDHVLVRKPAGIEAAGSMNILFTDKTGTLTYGKMRATALHLGTGEVLTLPLLRKGELSDVYACACLCNTSAMAERDAKDGSVRAIGGNATDRALFESALSDGKKLPTVGAAAWKLPFESERKYAAAMCDGQVHLKGAPERILPFVRRVLDKNGREVAADSAALQTLSRDLAAKGKRVLALAFCREKGTEAQYAAGDFGPLVLIGLAVLEDGLRKEAPKAVAELRGAGVQVVMITGDGKQTAERIARACGILGSGVDTVLDGTELAAMSDEVLRELLPRIGVVARALPSDKSRLVRLAQERDLVVGMTGDGINDAPALRKADVGFAMGDGTQVAREAGDIILLDNNLASVVNAVLYGRTVFKSIRKFIVLQLTMNFCAVGVSMICPFLGYDAPVTVVQMLWINMIMDTLGGLAFAGEAPKAFYMKEPPKRRDEPILNGYMIFQIFWQGLATVVVCLSLLIMPAITGRFRPAPDNIYLLTAFFALFIFMSVCNCFNARTDRLRLLAGIGKNPGFIGIMLAVTVIQIVFVYLGGSVLRTAPLTLSELGFTFSLALLAIPTELLRKIVWRLCGKKTGY